MTKADWLLAPNDCWAFCRDWEFRGGDKPSSPDPLDLTMQGVSTIRQAVWAASGVDYIIYQELLNFAEEAASCPEFACELPLFVAEIRRLFSAIEISNYLAALVPSVEAELTDTGDFEEDDDSGSMSPQEHAARCERLASIRQVLDADQLGTS